MCPVFFAHVTAVNKAIEFGCDLFQGVCKEESFETLFKTVWVWVFLFGFCFFFLILGGVVVLFCFVFEISMFQKRKEGDWRVRKEFVRRSGFDPQSLLQVRHSGVLVIPAVQVETGRFLSLVGQPSLIRKLRDQSRASFQNTK